MLNEGLATNLHLKQARTTVSPNMKHFTPATLKPRICLSLSCQHRTSHVTDARCLRTLKADSHIACRAHAVSLPCRAKGLECLSHLIYRVRPCLIHTCHAMPMPRPCHALTMPFFSRPRYSTAVERRSVGYLPAFGFFRLPRGVPRRLSSEAYQSSSQRSIPTTVKSGSSTLQKRRAVKLLD